MRWDPQTYLQFGAERARPVADLLTRVQVDDPRVVVDLGCGPGNLTAALAERWQHARVHGLDSSPEMISRAATLTGPFDGRLTFAVGDLRDWAVAGPDGGDVDVLFSNAALHWVPGHLDLFPDLVDRLTPGGWLAVQVPGNFGERTHTALAELASSPAWAPHFAGRDPGRREAVEPAAYLQVLAALGCRVEAWETTYLHVLDGEDAIVRWVSGTALRRYLSELDDDEQRSAFVDQYRSLVEAAYPRRPWGTVLPFRRVFVVAQRA